MNTHHIHKRKPTKNCYSNNYKKTQRNLNCSQQKHRHSWNALALYRSWCCCCSWFEGQNQWKGKRKEKLEKMSTSTLGGFEREERKILYDEYLFQRRVLFIITISIVFAAFVWTIAICTDHWIVVAGNERMYLWLYRNIFISFILEIERYIWRPQFAFVM